LTPSDKDLKLITAKNITDLRTAAKMTQLELGNAISYSDKAISKWERGEAVPDAYVLLQLSTLFGVTVDYILKEHEGEPSPKVKVTRANHASVSALAIIAVFTVFAIAFITVYLAVHVSYWLFFAYATVISLILLTVFNSLWGKKKLNILIVSALVSSIIATLYLILLPIGNFWQILLLIIPALLIVLCGFKLRRKLVSDFLRFKKKSEK
jgi:transcriptional regulator with XRE-family HTH domain